MRGRIELNFRDFAPARLWIVEVVNAHGSFYQCFDSKKEALEDVMYSGSTLTKRRFIGRYDFAPDGQPTIKKGRKR